MDKINIKDIPELEKYLKQVQEEYPVLAGNLRKGIKILVEAVVDKCAEEAQCTEGAIVDLGFEIISAHVESDSILKVKEEVNYG